MCSGSLHGAAARGRTRRVATNRRRPRRCLSRRQQLERFGKGVCKLSQSDRSPERIGAKSPILCRVISCAAARQCHEELQAEKIRRRLWASPKHPLKPIAIYRCFLARRPPAKASLRQTFGRQPEALAIIGQNADGFRAPAAKQKQTTRERIGVELLAAKLCHRIDALSAVDGLDRHQNARLRGDLNQASISHSDRLTEASSAAVPFNSMRSLPRWHSISITHGRSPDICGAISSTDAGGFARLFDTPRPAACDIRLRWLNSRPSTSATRLTPCSRASSPAAVQIDAGSAIAPCADSASAPVVGTPFSSASELQIRLLSRRSPCPGRAIRPTLSAQIRHSHAVLPKGNVVGLSGTGLHGTDRN